MPARHFVLIIIAFWAATSGWLFYHEVLPYVTPGAPPPFRISLADEAEAQKNLKEGIEWSIYQNDDIKGYAKTSVDYAKKSDTFSLNCEYKFWPLGRFSASDADVVIKSAYEVSRDGELQGLNAHASLRLKVVASLDISGDLTGTVKNGTLTLHVKSDPPFTIDQDIGTAEVRGRSLVMTPLQPLHRLPGLRKGQRWRTPMVEPLDDILNQVAAKMPILSSVQSSRIPFLDAQVLPETVILDRNEGKNQVECLVVEYHGEDLTARTWVGASDSQVYQQEVVRQGQRLKLVREDPGARLQDKINRGLFGKRGERK